MQIRSVRRWRWTALAALVAVVVGVVIYRVFAPTDVLTEAREPYPSVEPVTAGVVATLPAAPLFVDGRLRVYASRRQVTADQPIGAPARLTPYWSLRRWPAQLTAVVAAGTTVVSRWSDGQLIAQDARTGRITWRIAGPHREDQEYTGGNTGTATVYVPDGLHSGRTRDGRAVLVAVGDRQARGIDLTDGRELWRAPAGDNCRPDGFTTTGGFFAVRDTCGTPQALDFYDLATGERTARWQPDPSGGRAASASTFEVTPLACAVARSNCAAMRTTSGGDTRGWLLSGSGPVAAPPLDAPDASLTGDIVVRAPQAGTLTARSVRDNARLWQRGVPRGTRVLAVQPGLVHLLTPGRRLLTLDAASGALLSGFTLTKGRQETDWMPGQVLASDGFVAVERIGEPLHRGEDSEASFAAQPVILART